MRKNIETFAFNDLTQNMTKVKQELFRMLELKKSFYCELCSIDH